MLTLFQGEMQHIVEELEHYKHGLTGGPKKITDHMRQELLHHLDKTFEVENKKLSLSSIVSYHLLWDLEGL